MHFWLHLENFHGLQIIVLYEYSFFSLDALLFKDVHYKWWQI